MLRVKTREELKSIGAAAPPAPASTKSAEQMHAELIQAITQQTRAITELVAAMGASPPKN